MIKKVLLTIIFLGFVFQSCASKEERLEKQKAKVEEIKDNLNNERGDKLFYSSDSTRSSFTYFTVDGEIVIINEKMYIGNSGNSINLHFYDDDKIILTELKQLFYERKEKGFDKQSINIKIYFDYNGDVLASEKVLKRKIVEMTEEEQKYILNHSRKLFELSQNNLDKK